MFKKIEELIKNYFNYSLAKSDAIDIRIKKIGNEYVVSTLGFENYGYTIEDAINTLILSLETNNEYRSNLLGGNIWDIKN